MRCKSCVYSAFIWWSAYLHLWSSWINRLLGSTSRGRLTLYQGQRWLEYFVMCATYTISRAIRLWYSWVIVCIFDSPIDTTDPFSMWRSENRFSVDTQFVFVIRDWRRLPLFYAKFNIVFIRSTLMPVNLSNRSHIIYIHQRLFLR